MRRLLIGLAISSLTAGAANAALITNGSFELGSPQPALGTFNTLDLGSTNITGWAVVSGSIDWINAYWDAIDGTHSVDLAGNEPGAIEQAFATVEGQLYTVNYWLSGNPDGGDIAKQAVVAALNGAMVEANSTIIGIQGASRTDMQYLLNSFQFTATGATTTLRFTSNPSEGPYGAALDFVEVGLANAPIPEPSTWAMMFVGFGVVGVSMRRRHTMRRRHSMWLPQLA